MSYALFFHCFSISIKQVIVGVFVGVMVGVFVGVMVGVFVGVLAGVTVGVLVGARWSNTSSCTHNLIVGPWIADPFPTSQCCSWTSDVELNDQSQCLKFIYM